MTFNDDNLAPDLSLHKEDFVTFMKRLREKFDRVYGTKIRFFHSGEYGDKNFRESTKYYAVNEEQPQQLAQILQEFLMNSDNIKNITQQYIASGALNRVKWAHGGIR